MCWLAWKYEGVVIVVVGTASKLPTPRFVFYSILLKEQQEYENKNTNLGSVFESARFCNPQNTCEGT